MDVTGHLGAKVPVPKTKRAIVLRENAFWSVSSHRPSCGAYTRRSIVLIRLALLPWGVLQRFQAVPPLAGLCLLPLRQRGLRAGLGGIVEPAPRNGSPRHPVWRSPCGASNAERASSESAATGTDAPAAAAWWHSGPSRYARMRAWA